ncbi:MAG: sensor histidine kinase [Caulobacteraceae bacterium]
MALAAMGTARWEAAGIAAAAMAALTCVLWLRQARRGRVIATAPASPPDQGAAAPFAAMIEHLADPILLAAGGDAADPSARRYAFANAAARGLLRLRRADGPLATALRGPDLLEAIDETLFKGAATQTIYRSGGAQERVWRATALPLTVEGSGPLALIALRDETEFRRGERTRADFLANASHELRTPLASLAGFIETLRGHARDDPAARETFLAIMHGQAQRMRRLIDDLMSLSRIELGEHIPPLVEVDVAAAAADVLDALGPMAAERGVAFRSASPSEGEAVIPGDRDQIQQVIQNLAENALKYTPRGGTVEVEIASGLDAASASQPASALAAHRALLTPDRAEAARYVALRVRDAGPGIARAQLPRLTERFYRVEGQKSGEHAGTGLGLAIVKHIVNRQRGGLTVESAEGQGSVFTAYLPMGHEAERAP